MGDKEMSRIKKNIKKILNSDKPFLVASKLIESNGRNIPKKIRDLINKQYEYIANERYKTLCAEEHP